MEDPSPEQIATAHPLPVLVGIGASAGGIMALKALFAALPAKVGAAMVVIVHLDPEYQSEISNIIAAHTHLHVHQASNRPRDTLPPLPRTLAAVRLPEIPAGARPQRQPPPSTLGRASAGIGGAGAAEHRCGHRDRP